MAGVSNRMWSFLKTGTITAKFVATPMPLTDISKNVIATSSPGVKNDFDLLLSFMVVMMRALCQE